MQDFQFYPTPDALARKAWALFRNRDFTRVLEPSAGEGDLIKAMPGFDHPRRRGTPVDVCEIDLGKHPHLRQIDGVSVVGTDFLQFGGCSIYSHIIQNPPFAQGVHHVLKAWDGMFDGEIVSIINAETIRNPFSRERKLLVSLIEQHGAVEFVQDAFMGDEVRRESPVEIALVYLRKRSRVGEDVVGSIYKNLRQENEQASAARMAAEFERAQDLVIPATVIENLVITFDAAVACMRETVVAEARANHYEALIGSTMAELTSECSMIASAKNTTDWVQTQMVERYLRLKDRAWANLLRSSQVEKHLSSGAQRRLQSAFQEIKTLEFTVQNVQGFLAGLVENQGSIMREMACDVFDLIVRYHTDNVVFYKGWVSNDKQRTCGMRLKKSRFVIPGNTTYGGSLAWEAQRRLADFDRVMSMLDGKEEPEVSLVSLFKDRMNELKAGERLSGTYIDVRFYPRAGTIHFYPRNQEIMDKLNKLVGEHRQWLPRDPGAMSEDFRRQYAEADRFDKELREEVVSRVKVKAGANKPIMRWDNPLSGIMMRDESERSAHEIYDALTAVQARHGIAVDAQLQHASAQSETRLQLELAA